MICTFLCVYVSLLFFFIDKGRWRVNKPIVVRLFTRSHWLTLLPTYYRSSSSYFSPFSSLHKFNNDTDILDYLMDVFIFKILTKYDDFSPILKQDIVFTLPFKKAENENAFFFSTS